MKIKILNNAVITMAILVFNLDPVMGIEDLQIRVQGTDAILSWPSVEGETFIVRYRARLDAAHPWTLLAASYPAVSGANRTTFTHTGIVEYPSGGGGGGGGNPPPPLMSATSDNSLIGQAKKPKQPPLPALPPLP